MIHGFKKAALLGAVSVAAVLGAAPAHALTLSSAVYGGGGSLAAVIDRTILDCYGHVVTGDIKWPKCTSASFPYNGAIESMYASVGSGQGINAFVTNNANQFYKSATAAPWTTLPSGAPIYSDGAQSFTTFPYPVVSYAAGDAPLTSASAGDTTVSGNGPSVLTTTQLTNDPTATSSSGGTVAYDFADWGNPINIPAFITSVTLAVNTSGLDQLNTTVATKYVVKDSLNGYNTLTTTSTVFAPQLSIASYCAIFGGKVSDWSDNTTTFVQSNAAGVTSTTTLGADNKGVAFSSSSLPINVVYRSDGSGTSNIFSEHLSKACAPLGYAFIRTPNDKYKPGVNEPTVAHPDPQNGSKAVASEIANVAGSIGYVSPDYTFPFAQVDASGDHYVPGTTIVAPVPAAIQSFYNVFKNVLHPTSATSFAQPTVANLGVAATIANSAGAFPAPGADYTQWDLNPYIENSLVSYSAKQFYPIAGATYFYLYTCYSQTMGVDLTQSNALFNQSTAHGAKVGQFIWWYKTGAATVKAVLNGSGFVALPGSATGSTTLLGTVYNDFFTGTTGSANKINGTACSGKTGVHGA